MIKTNFLRVFIRNRSVTSEKMKNRRKKPQTAEQMSSLTGMIVFC